MKNRCKSQTIRNLHDITSIQKQLKQINEKLTNVITKNDGSVRDIIKEVIEQMKDELFKSVSKQIEVLESRLFDKEIENDNLKKQLEHMDIQLKNNITENEQLRDELNITKQKAERDSNIHEQYSRRNNIRINGIQQTDDKETAEQTCAEVCKQLNAKIKITGFSLTPQHIDIAHRLGKLKDGKRQIIVRFQSRMIRDKIMAHKKLLKGSGIFITDDLTQLNNHVLSCFRYKCPDEVESAWSHNGKILYENKQGNIHEVKFEDYQHWIDLTWPQRTNKSDTSTPDH